MFPLNCQVFLESENIFMDNILIQVSQGYKKPQKSQTISKMLLSLEMFI